MLHIRTSSAFLDHDDDYDDGDDQQADHSLTTVIYHSLTGANPLSCLNSAVSVKSFHFAAKNGEKEQSDCSPAKNTTMRMNRGAERMRDKRNG
jgi:hypothetical protein